ncbi:MAG: DUF6504 family protein [Ornithinimicrobium sp.]
MSRQYHERIEVHFGEVLLGRLHDTASLYAERDLAVPTAFAWRGRHHVVRAVVAQWTQRLPWWRMSAAEHVGTPGLENHAALEHDVWRVEASVGSVWGTGVYDLAQGEHWRLVRVVD